MALETPNDIRNHDLRAPSEYLLRNNVIHGNQVNEIKIK